MKKTVLYRCIAILSIIGLMVCTALLFPQGRRMVLNLAEHIVHKEFGTYQLWYKTLLSYSMGGIFFILFFDYCTLTASGRALVYNVKREIKDSLSEIDFRSLLKPFLIMSVVYFLGIFTIIRANFLYIDDIGRSILGFRGWHGWSRYVSEFASIFVHADTNLTDISPLPQLLAILILSISSVLLVYIIANKKITTVRLLASIPLGLSPFFLECLSFKFDAPYMALSILASIVPFLLISRKKAFFFSSVLSLLIMCMTYMVASGVYLMIAVILCFQDWNSKKKTTKEILSFLGVAVFAFGFAMLLFRLFLMKSVEYVYGENSVSTSMFPLSQMVFGVLGNIKNYTMSIYHDLGMIWKIGIALVCFFFILKSMHESSRRKAYSFFISILIIGIVFVLSYGLYSLLMNPLFYPRSLFGFGIFLAIVCIYIVLDYKKAAVVVVLALNWCFLVFAFSYGNALAEQKRYAEFRISILLHDLSVLYPNPSEEKKEIQLANAIEFAPSIKNIAKNYPVIERMVPKHLGGDYYDDLYYLTHFNFNQFEPNEPAFTSVDFNTMDLPVVFDSFYHTIKSDGKRILVVLRQ